MCLKAKWLFGIARLALLPVVLVPAITSQTQARAPQAVLAACHDDVRRLCAAVLWNAEARRIAANGEATVPTPEELEAMLAQRQARYAEPHWGAP